MQEQDRGPTGPIGERHVIQIPPAGAPPRRAPDPHAPASRRQFLAIAAAGAAALLAGALLTLQLGDDAASSPRSNQAAARASQPTPQSPLREAGLAAEVPTATPRSSVAPTHTPDSTAVIRPPTAEAPGVASAPSPTPATATATTPAVTTAAAPAPAATSAPTPVPQASTPTPPVVAPTPLASTPAATSTATRTANASDDFNGRWRIVDTVEIGIGTGQTFSFDVQLAQQGTNLSGSGTGIQLSGVVMGDTAVVRFVQPGLGYTGMFEWTLRVDRASGSFTSTAPNGGTSQLTRLP